LRRICHNLNWAILFEVWFNKRIGQSKLLCIVLPVVSASKAAQPSVLITVFKAVEHHLLPLQFGLSLMFFDFHNKCWDDITRRSIC
jgi:hypothetical protein